MAREKDVNDFMDTLRGLKKHATSVNRDGSVKLTKLADGSTVHPQVFFASGGGTVTDANPTGTRVRILFADNSVGIADGQAFIESLR